MNAAPNAAFARALISHLGANGVTRYVLCPGSRSGPLAHALTEAASPNPPHGAPAIELHVRIDERSAGFVALGLALATGEPVGIVTTSGTAVGNLLPAVMEAYHSGVPLVVLTADRPFDVRGTGANQTTDQRGIFGRFVQWSRDVYPPVQGRTLAAETATLVGQAMAHAMGAVPAPNPAHETVGPVHFNLQFDAPLGPDHADWPWGTEAALQVTSDEAIPPLPDLRRGVVIAGHGAGQAAASVALTHGWPLFAEPTSGCRTGTAAIPGYLDALASDRGGVLLDDIAFVLAVGRPTLSRGIAQLIRDTPRLWVARWGGRWRDAPLHAEVVARDVPFEWMQGPVRVTEVPAPDSWLAQWHGVAREPILEEWSARTVAAVVAASVGRGDALVVGSSGPIRALDEVLPVVRVAESPRVFANRGLAGIDGTVSTAVGIALASSGKVHALMGDLTFLHDIGGLLVGPLERRPNVRIVVVNDGGGTMFSGLEHAAVYADRFARAFTAPHDTNIAALCAGYRVPHTAVTDRPSLTRALVAPPRGIEVIEARVEPGPVSVPGVVRPRRRR